MTAAAAMSASATVSVSGPASAPISGGPVNEPR
jgi:hypothetical protein